MARKSKFASIGYVESVDLLLQVWVRFIIAFSSLLALHVGPNKTILELQLIHAFIIAYCLYGALFLFEYDMQYIRKLSSIHITHWIDTLFILGLIALTGGESSNFYPFIIFPIIVASFTWGFAEGIKVTIVAAIFFVALSIVAIVQPGDYMLSDGIMRAIYIAIFGYMIAYFGGGRIILNRRLELLRDISTNWNPRVGVDQAITSNLNRFEKFYAASRCIVVMKRVDMAPEYLMYSSSGAHQKIAEKPVEILEDTANELLILPPTLAVAFASRLIGNLLGFDKYLAFDVLTRETTERYQAECEHISSLLDDESFISVPYHQQGVTFGRLFLTFNKRTLNRSEVEFAIQVADVMSSVVDNMKLIEKIIAEVGGRERRRLSLDVHDSTIQPYIGLTLALNGLQREFKDDTRLSQRISAILAMANTTIQDLRNYNDNLREQLSMRGDVLISSVKSQNERLHQFYGIDVDLKGNVDSDLPGDVAEAAFQIIKEGQSNILRHTNAKRAFVHIDNTTQSLILSIGNEIDRDSPENHFTPKSIFERVTALKGDMRIEVNNNGFCIIHVEIPLKRNSI
jgi:signal transduction histidine kinase